MFIPALLFLYIISRIVFINAGGVFFDSPEYLHLFSLPNYFQALVSGHHPLHLGYLALFWPVFQLATFFHLNGAITVVIGQIILSVITIYCFYQLITVITDKKIALLATIFISLIPLYWIITDTIMMENAYLCFFFLSTYFLTKYLSLKRNYYLLFIAQVFFILAVITHSMVTLWLPFLWYLVYFKNKKYVKHYFIISLLSSIFAYILNFVIMAATSDVSWQTLFYEIAKEKDDIAILHWDIQSLLVILRDFFILQMRNYTSLLTLLGLLAFIKLYKENKHLFFLAILWIVPALYINLWWDVLLPGRYAALSGFGIAFSSAYQVRNHKYVSLLVICYLLIVTIPAVSLLRKPIPYLTEANYTKNLPKDSLLIASHFSRPQIQQTFKGKLIAVNEDFWTNEDFEKIISSYLSRKKTIYISSDALSDPYGLYTGPYLHPLSLSYTHPFQLTPLLSNYKWKVYKVINKKDNLIMYQIIDHGKSQYPQVMNLQRSYRRLDYYDPITRLWWFLEDLMTHK